MCLNAPRLLLVWAIIIIRHTSEGCIWSDVDIPLLPLSCGRRRGRCNDTKRKGKLITRTKSEERNSSTFLEIFLFSLRWEDQGPFHVCLLNIKLWTWSSTYCGNTSPGSVQGWQYPPTSDSPKWQLAISRPDCFLAGTSCQATCENSRKLLTQNRL